MTRFVYRRIEIELEPGDKEELKDWLFGALHTYTEGKLAAGGFPINEVLTALAMVAAAAITAENEDDPEATKRELEAFLSKLNASIVFCMEPDAFTPEGRPN